VPFLLYDHWPDCLRVIEQARTWLLRSRRWAQHGLDRLANAEEVLTDHESVAGFAEALQAIVDVTQPSQVWSIESKAQLLALIDLVSRCSGRATFAT
jgi:hypothetical protein